MKDLERGEQVAEKAMATLSRRGAAVVPELTDALNHPLPKVRERAAETLERIGASAKRAAKSLRARLNDEECLVRMQAMYALAAIGVCTKPLAIEVATSDEDHFVRSVALDWLGERAGALASFIEVARRAEHHDQQPVRPLEQIADHIGYLARPSASALGRFLRDDCIRVRVVVADRAGVLAAYGRIRPETWRPTLRDDSDVRDLFLKGVSKGLWWATSALYNVPAIDRRRAARFTIGTHDMRFMLRTPSNAVLGVLPSTEKLTPAMLDTVIETLKDSELRSAALRAIGKLGREAAKALPALRSLDRRTRWPRSKQEVARAVFDVSGDAEPLLRVLRKSLAARKGLAFSDASGHIMNLGPAALPLLPELIEAVSKGPDVYRQSMAWAIGAIGPDAAPSVPALLRQAVRTDPNVATGSRLAITEIGPTAIPALEKASTGRSPKIRVLAKELIRTIRESDTS